MLPGLTILFLLLSVLCIVASATSPPKAPLWIGTILLWMAVALQVWPK